MLFEFRCKNFINPHMSVLFVTVLQVAVLDFPPRLAADLPWQEALRQEYHRVTGRLGVRWFPAADAFCLESTDLWARDGVSRTVYLDMKITVCCNASVVNDYNFCFHRFTCPTQRGCLCLLAFCGRLLTM